MWNLFHKEKIAAVDHSQFWRKPVVAKTISQSLAEAETARLKRIEELKAETAKVLLK